MKRLLLLSSGFLMPVALASCSGGGAGSPAQSGPTPPPVIVRSFTFPSGDAVAAKGTAWDIVGLKTTLSGTGINPLGNSYDKLQVDVIFAQDVSGAVPPPGSSLNFGSQIGVSVGLDIDGNPATGFSPPCDTTATSRAFEYLSDQGNGPSRLADGNYSVYSNGQPIYSGAPNPPAEAVFSVFGNTLSYLFNLNTLGGAKGTQVPRIGINARAFNGSDSAVTDCVPTINSGAIEVFTSS